MDRAVLKKRVLIIEVEPDMGIYLSNLLEAAGFNPMLCEGEYWMP